MEQLVKQVSVERGAAEPLGRIPVPRGITPCHHRRTPEHSAWMVTEVVTALESNPTVAAIAAIAAIAPIAAVTTVAHNRVATVSTVSTVAAVVGREGSASTRQHQTGRQYAGGHENAKPPPDVVMHGNLRSRDLT